MFPRFPYTYFLFISLLLSLLLNCFEEHSQLGQLDRLERINEIPCFLHTRGIATVTFWRISPALVMVVKGRQNTMVSMLNAVLPIVQKLIVALWNDRELTQVSIEGTRVREKDDKTENKNTLMLQHRDYTNHQFYKFSFHLSPIYTDYFTTFT